MYGPTVIRNECIDCLGGLTCVTAGWVIRTYRRPINGEGQMRFGLPYRHTHVSYSIFLGPRAESHTTHDPTQQQALWTWTLAYGQEILIRS